jgi:hypothetical protein
MSTKIQDFANQAYLKAASGTPTAKTSTVTGTGLDFITGDGRCFAIQNVGTVSGTSPTLNGRIQESADNSTWSDVSGATFTQVTASTSLQIITFDRTLRYLRYVGTIAGTSPSFDLDVLIGEQKKQL